MSLYHTLPRQQDTVMYPYYGHLNSLQKALYLEILPGIQQAESSIAIKQKAESEDVFAAVGAIYYDHPEIFWMTSGCRVSTINDIVKTLEPGYNQLERGYLRKREQLDSAVGALITGLPISTIDQVVQVHDRLVKNLNYRYTENDQTAYAALVEGKAVCSGYSRAFQLVMQVLRIPCYLCRGYGKDPKTGRWEPHAWNILQLDGEYYNMDLTWDDCYDSNPGKDIVAYTYFNCTDTAIADNHKRGSDSVFLPRCSGTRYSFERVSGISPALSVIYQEGVTNRTVVKNKDSYVNLAAAVLRQRKRDTITFSFPTNSRQVVDKALEWLDAAVKQSGVSYRKMRMHSNSTDYNNGWYRVEVTIEIQ